MDGELKEGYGAVAGVLLLVGGVVVFRFEGVMGLLVWSGLSRVSNWLFLRPWAANTARYGPVIELRFVVNVVGVRCRNIELLRGAGQLVCCKCLWLLGIGVFLGCPALNRSSEGAVCA